MPIFLKPSIPLQTASRMIEVAIEHAAEIGICISVAIVDESGILKAFARMDGSPLVAVEVARNKALTAVGFGIPTGQAWINFSQGDEILEKGIHSLPNFTMFTGGHPLRLSGTVAGAIGVSGAHYSQDDACARAALRLLDEAPEDGGERADT